MDWGLGIGDWGHFDKLSASLGIGDWGLGILDGNQSKRRSCVANTTLSSIPNPKLKGWELGNKR
ncbi:hypothetical protein CV014_19190 [Nostoc sp. CMAA1605]|nr:hypothetical protein [Nostoc sp. CMAA1605]